MASLGERFYARARASSSTAARSILPLVLDVVPDVRSVVDVGCGVGSWLSELRELGVEDILGIEGEWVPAEHFVVPLDRVLRHDLTRELALGRRFDLAISLEVAEHLPEDRAGGFVRSLVGLSDFVLFSAAVPFQHGVGHVNEQWPDYWADLFEDQGFAAVDPFRAKIWNERSIEVWYRQNLLLFAKKSRVRELGTASAPAPGPLSVVHPELFLQRARLLDLPLRLLLLLPRVLRRRIRRRLGV